MIRSLALYSLPLLFCAACGTGAPPAPPSSLPPDDDDQEVPDETVDVPLERMPFLVFGSEEPLLLERATFSGGSASLRQQLEDEGCGGLLDDEEDSDGSGGLVFETRASLPAGLTDWLASEIDDGPQEASGDVFIKIPDIPGESSESACAASLPDATLDRLVLLVDNDDDGTPVATLRFELLSSSAPERTDPTTLPDLPDDVTAPAPEPVPVGLLLPAVQKVRDLPPPKPASSAEGYPLFIAGTTAPPPFEIDLSEEQAAALEQDELPADPEVLLVFGYAKRPQYFRWELKDVIVTSLTMSAESASPATILAPSPPADETPAEQLEALVELSDDVLSLVEVDRMLGMLDGQPEGAELTPAEQQEALLEYWQGDAGVESTFVGALGRLLERSADEEGLWSYARLLTASRLFWDLDTAEGRRPAGMSAMDIEIGRAFSFAALERLKTASFRMRPGTLVCLGPDFTHDYRLAHSTVTLLAEAAPLLVDAEPHTLVSVVPGDVDIAEAAVNEIEMPVALFDARAFSLLAALNDALQAIEPTAEHMAQLQDETVVVRSALLKLRAATELRFAVTH